jgi:hypothetical protein
VRSGSTLDLGTLITDLLAEVRVGSPKPSRTYSCAVKDTCQAAISCALATINLTRRFDVHRWRNIAIALIDTDFGEGKALAGAWVGDISFQEFLKCVVTYATNDTRVIPMQEIVAVGIQKRTTLSVLLSSRSGRLQCVSGCSLVRLSKAQLSRRLLQPVCG